MKNKTVREYQNNKRFFNPYQDIIKRHFWNMLLWKLGYYKEPHKRPLPPEGFKYPVSEENKKSSYTCTWINHCSFLISLDNINILTDPIFSKYCAPFPIYSLKRKHKPALSIKDLPKIDYVLVSHNHYDHLDKYSVDLLNKIFPEINWIVPLGLYNWFKKRNVKNIFELGWWKEKNFYNDLTVCSVPSQHFSGRNFFNMNKTLWSGYVVLKDAKKLYFAGDTGYNPYNFTEIGNEFGPMDLSLIPIGTYCPRPFMKFVHIDPNEAVLIHKEVKSKLSIGMHWKTFKLSDEPMNLPPYDLYNAMVNAKLPFNEFLAVDSGALVNW